MIADGDLELFARGLRSATADKTGPALDAALGELGWHDALALDPQVAVSLLFTLQGEANANSSALDHVLAHVLGGKTPVILPRIGQWRPPGAVVGQRLSVDGIAPATLASGTTALVVTGTRDGCVGFDVASEALSHGAGDGIDPRLGLVQVTGLVADPTEIGPVDWRAAVALGQLALGHELVGAARQMLELARQHSLDRIQFGQPIAKFQAVRHRLAETLVAIEAADALLDAAWTDREPLAAAMAKAMAGRGARGAARHCQQVLAGIGFTTEHPLHRYVKRVLILEQLLGSTRRLTLQLGAEVLERQELPALVPL